MPTLQSTSVLGTTIGLAVVTLGVFLAAYVAGRFQHQRGRAPIDATSPPPAGPGSAQQLEGDTARDASTNPGEGRVDAGATRAPTA